MKYERYELLYRSGNGCEFRFDSVGPKGKIEITVQFSPVEDSGVTNLAFGNRRTDGSMDDLARNNNEDRDKVLFTVVSAIYDFTTRYLETSVFFAGSTPGRNRLYRMLIAAHLGEWSADFEISGITAEDCTFQPEPFEKDRPYMAFLIKRKKI